MVCLAADSAMRKRVALIVASTLDVTRSEQAT